MERRRSSERRKKKKRRRRSTPSLPSQAVAALDAHSDSEAASIDKREDHDDDDDEASTCRRRMSDPAKPDRVKKYTSVSDDDVKRGSSSGATGYHSSGEGSTRLMHDVSPSTPSSKRRPLSHKLMRRKEKPEAPSPSDVRSAIALVCSFSLQLNHSNDMDETMVSPEKSNRFI